MSTQSALSKAEMEVARIVWERGKATVRDVCEALSESREVEYKTIQTFLRRLEAKGYVKSERVERSLVYSPRTRPQTVIREAVADFVHRLFGGEALPLLEHVIQEQGLTPDDVRKLREMLERADRKGAKKHD